MNRAQRRAMKASTIHTAEPPKQPRQLDEINKEYQGICAEAGQLQYNIKALETKLGQHNLRISQLGEEANARTELDKQQPKQQELAV